MLLEQYLTQLKNYNKGERRNEISRKKKHLINGELVSMGDPTQDVFNPSTGEVGKQVEIASKNTVEQAINAAQEAFPAWRATPPLKRARIMFRFKELLEKKY